MGNLRKWIASLGVVSILSTLVVTTTVAAGEIPYEDVSEDASYYDAVVWLADMGVITTENEDGTARTEYRPGDTLIRNEALKLAMLAAGHDMADIEAEAGCTAFVDVPADRWDNAYVCYAYARDVIQGKVPPVDGANGQFDPTAEVTNAEFVKMVYAASGVVLEEGNPWYENYMAQAVEDGVVSASVDANSKATRGDVAVYTQNTLTMEGGEEEEEEEGEEGEEEEVETGGDGGELTVSVSDNTPDGATIPGAVANAKVAVFEFEADSGDVEITSIEFVRTGLADDDAVDSIALVDENGVRLSKSKSFTSGEDLATVNILDGGFTVEEGESLEVTVLATVGASATYQGDTFGVAIESVSAISTDASEVSGSFPLESEEMEIGGSDAGTIEIDDDTASPDVSVGEQGVEILAFEITGDSSDRDIDLYGIRFEHVGTADEEEDFGNLVLEIEGEVVATVDAAVNDFVNFVLDESYRVEDSKNYNAKVYADILGGAGTNIQFGLDSTLDVDAMDTGYGFGAGVTDAFTATTTATSIEAGDITIVAIDPEFDSFDADKDDLILGTVEVTVNSGSDIELQKVNFVFENADADLDLDDTFENVELVTDAGTYDLTGESLTDNNGNYLNDDLDILIEEGKTFTMMLRADTKAEAAGFDLDDVDLTISVGSGTDSDGSIGAATAATSDMYFEESDDNTAVTDVTPSSFSFNSLSGAETSATVTALTQSASKQVVVGASDVPVLMVEVDAGEASDLLVRDFTIEQAAGTATFSSATYSQFKLYHTEVAEENLLDSQSGSQISGGQLRFDFAAEDVTIPADEDLQFVVVASVVDDEGLDTQTSQIEVTDLDIKDNDNDPVTATDSDGTDLAAGGNGVASTRTITINATGTLTTTVDTTDSLANKAKLVLSGSTSDAVASFEVTANNEGINIEDMVILQTQGSANDLADYVSEVVLYNAAMEEIDRESVTSNAVTFNDVNYEVEEGSENLYVKVVAHRDGKDLPGAQTSLTGDLNLSMLVTRAEGADSGKVLSASAAIDLDETPADINITAQTGNQLTFNANTNLAVGDVFLLDENNADPAAPAPYNVVVVDVPTSSTVVTVVKLADFSDIGTVDTANETVAQGTATTATVTHITAESLGFATVPVHVSDVAFVSSFSGESMPTGNKLSNGEVVAAIVQIDTAESTNTDNADGGALLTLVDSITLTESRYSLTLVDEYTMERIDGVDSSVNGYNMEDGETLDFTVPAADPGTNFIFHINGTEYSQDWDTDATTTCDAIESLIEGEFEDGANETDCAAGVGGAFVLTVEADADTLVSFKNVTDAGSGSADSSEITFDLSALSSDDEVTNGETAYFVVDATTELDTTAETDDFLKLSFEAFTAGEVTYSSDEAGAVDITDLRLPSKTNLSGTQLNESN